MGTASRLPVVQAICGDRGRTDVGRSPRRVVGGRESRPQGEGGQEAVVFLMPGEYSVDTEQGPLGSISNVQRNMLSG
jgi:hypothetical protein